MDPRTDPSQEGNMDRNEDRLERNADSTRWADHHRQPWTEYEDEFLQELWTDSHTEQALVEIAEALGRTIEACRERYYKVRRAEAVTYTTRTVTERRGQTETRETKVEKRRPAWMDEEDLPEWYV